MNWLGWALASALFAALTAILAKIGVAGVDATLATAVRTCVVLVFTWIMVWLNPAAGGLHGLTPRNWGFLVLSGIATGLSWLCYLDRNLRRPRLYLDHGLAEPGRRRVARVDAAELGLPGALRHRHRPFLALLFPGARDGAGLARGAHR